LKFTLLELQTVKWLLLFSAWKIDQVD